MEGHTMKILLVSITLLFVVAQPATAQTVLVASRNQACIEKCLSQSKNMEAANACISRNCRGGSMGDGSMGDGKKMGKKQMDQMDQDESMGGGKKMGKKNKKQMDQMDESMGGANEVVILHGCPDNLDKVCKRNRQGKLVKCRCAS